MHPYMTLPTRPYLLFDQHGHVLEHVVQLFDAVLQFHNVLMSGLDVLQGLTRRVRVHQDLNNNNTMGSKKQRPRLEF